MAINSSGYKRCPRCGESKLAATSFFRSAKSPDGRGGYCKSCVATYNREEVDPERRRQYDREHYRKNPERRRKVRERLDRWRQENPEKARQSDLEKARRYAARYPERLKAAHQRYRQSEKGKAKIAERNTTEAYKLSHRLRESFYRSRRDGYAPTGGRFSNEEWKAILEAHDHKCAYCDATEDLTVDHVQPISRGGSHDVSNVVPACGPCNSSKNDQTPEEWLGRVPGMDVGDPGPPA